MNILLLLLSGAIIEGRVWDAGTHNPLPQVNVYLEDTDFGTVTDEKGRYRIENIPEGRYVLVFSMIGYKEERVNIELKSEEKKRVDRKLSLKPIGLKEVRVTARRAEFEEEARPSIYTLRTREFEFTPTFIESDLFRILQAIPGVVATSDFSSALYVRGGGPDQNIVLFDDAEVYMPFHLGGLFSTFDLDAIESARFLTGGFPARYGGRLSSVLEVESKVSKSKGLSGAMELGVLATSLRVGSPFFLFSFRHTYFDKTLKLLNIDFPYHFYDGQGSIRVEPFKNTILRGSGFISGDVFSYNLEGFDIDFDWYNRVASLTLKQILGEKRYLNFNLSYTNFEANLRMANVLKVCNRINQCKTRGEGVWVFDKHRLTVGLEGQVGGFDYDLERPIILYLNVHNHHNSYAGIYISDRLKPSRRWVFEPGLRWDFYYVDYPDTLHRTYIVPSPRFSAKYFLSGNTALTLATGRFNQFIAVTLPEWGMLPTYFWIPIYGSFKPQSCYHIISGIEKISEKGEMKVEIYYKPMQSLLVFNDYLDPLNIPNTLFLSASGKAYGLDILLKRDVGDWIGWISYSLEFSKFERDGKEYPTSFDRRHSLNIVGGYRFGKGWRVSLKFNIGTGLPYTPIVARFARYYWEPITGEYRYLWWSIPGEKNSVRYPTYHRLDISLSKSFSIGWGEFKVCLEIINLYNHKNIFFYYYDYSVTPPLKKAMYQLPLFPSIKIEGSF